MSIFKNNILNEENKNDLVPSFYIFLLTAKSHQSLKDLATKYLSLLQAPHHQLLGVCHSLLTRRTFFKHKLIINCKSREDLCFLLKEFIEDDNKSKGINKLHLTENLGSKPKIAYVFSGQGGQWFAMGRHLIAHEPIFKKSIEEINILLKEIANWSLIEEMSKSKAESLINKTEIVQPAIFAIQVSLVKLLEYHGIKPHGVIGHSLGETAAAYHAGALSLKDAVYVIYHRSRIQAKQAKLGKILAVRMGIDEAKRDIEIYENRVSIAAINGPNMLTIAGDTEPLSQLAKFYTAKGYFNRFVNAEAPYHSHYMDVLEQELVTYLSNTNRQSSTIPLYSTVSARREDGLHLTGEYWFKNVRYPVLFTDTIKVMIEDGFNLFIEIGSHPLLVEGMNSLFEGKSYPGISFSLMNRKFEDETNYYRQGVARLVANNASVDIERLLKYQGRKSW